MINQRFGFVLLNVVHSYLLMIDDDLLLTIINQSWLILQELLVQHITYGWLSFAMIFQWNHIVNWLINLIKHCHCQGVPPLTKGQGVSHGSIALGFGTRQGMSSMMI